MNKDGKQTTNWSEKISERAERTGRSVIRELLNVANQGGVISFAGGLPASETLPLETTKKVVAGFNERKVLQYCSTEGIADLRSYLARNTSQYGIEAETDNILPTAGSQQALDLLGRLFLDKADVIISSSPTYTGAIQAFNLYGPEFKTVELDKDGMKVEQVEGLLKEYEVKFIYVLPNFHNPAGVTLSEERREKLVKVAAKNGAFIVEDDPYGELRFEGNDIVPIFSLHKENVIYLSTFSKILAPGFRLGWVAAPRWVIDQLVKMKQGVDLCNPAFVQYTACSMCEREGFLEDQIKNIRELYGERRDVMLESMERYFPEGVEWTHPQGGLFLWASLPQGDTEELFNIALEDCRVAFVYGSAFLPNREKSSSMRLNFSYMNPSKIKEGIKRLGEAINDYL